MEINLNLDDDKAYIKENHTTDECIGFVDGINKTLELIAKINESKTK